MRLAAEVKFMHKPRPRIICAKMAETDADAEEYEQGYPMSDEDRAIPRTAEDFEREINEYTASDAFAFDVAQAIPTAEATPSPLDSFGDNLWRILHSKLLDNKTEFDEQCQAGFSTATQATDAANQFAGLRLTWSRKPPQSQMDMKVAYRIPGDGQKYQRLVGC